MLLPQSLAQHADEYTSHWWSSCSLFPISFLLAYWGFHQLYVPDQGQPLTYRQYWTPIKNILIVVVNFWLAVAIWNNAQALNYNFLCEPVGNPASSSWIWDDKSGRNALIHAMKDKSFYFLLVKIVECLDTIVMSMRGGLYYTWVFWHHFSMIIFGWVVIVFVPAGTTSIILLVSCVGHVLDYVFIILRRLPGPLNGANYLLTYYNVGQLAVIVFVAMSSGFQDCGYPLFPSLGISVIGTFFIFEQLWRA